MHAIVEWIEYPRIMMLGQPIFGRVLKGSHRLVRFVHYHHHTYFLRKDDKTKNYEIEVMFFSILMKWVE
jgi:hypothetical protein